MLFSFDFDLLLATIKSMHLKYSLVRLDSSLPEPLYLQLANELQRISNSLCLNSTVRFPTQRELSLRLGVDRSTVRRAYNELLRRKFIEHRSSHTLYVSSETRRKLVNEFPSIGIIIPTQFSRLVDVQGGFILRYISGIIDSATEKNISTLMIQLPAADAVPEVVKKNFDELSHRLIGLIHLGDRGFFPDYPLQALLSDQRIVQLVISALPKSVQIGAVVADPAIGAQALAEQLLQFRHRKIGFLLWTDSWDPPSEIKYFTYESFLRPAGIKAVFHDYGLSCSDENSLFSCQNYQRVKGQITELIRKKELPDAFCCCNDVVAGWAIQACEENGLRVPDDISVIGFDGCSHAPLQERLTTISLPFYAIGFKAVDRLIDYQENGLQEDNRILKLQTSLVMKKTLSWCRN